MLIRRGFTVVELVVVMVIMAILLALAGVSINSSRANGRDAERKADTEAIARGLEVRYTRGKLNPAVTTAPAYVAAGVYPSISEMRHITGQTLAAFTPPQIVGGYGPVAIPGTKTETFSPPGLSGAYAGLVLASSCAVEDLTCIGAAVTTDAYYYEPIDKYNAVCLQDGCVRFNLYWRRETGDTATSLQQIRSKHQ